MNAYHAPEHDGNGWLRVADGGDIADPGTLLLTAGLGEGHEQVTLWMSRQSMAELRDWLTTELA